MSKNKKHKDKDDCNCHDDGKRVAFMNHFDDDCHDKDKKDKCDDDKDKGKDDKKHHPKPPPPKHHKTCVKEVLKAIHEAQLKVKRDSESKNTSKESELLESKKPKKNSIPFILFAEDSEPFKGTGVTTFNDTKHKKFKCITSYVFRIKDLEGKCAVLELLTFKSKKCQNEHCKKCSKKDDSVYGQIHCENVDDLIKTGIYINVDLSCFCAVTCLPAVRL